MGSLNRRALFGAVPAVAVVGLPSRVAANSRLADLGLQWQSARAEADRINVDYDAAQARFDALGLSMPRGLPSDRTEKYRARWFKALQETGCDACEQRWDDAQDRIMEIERQIIKAPCHSVADAQIKAQVALANPDNEFGSDAARSVVEFVLRMGAN